MNTPEITVTLYAFHSPAAVAALTAAAVEHQHNAEKYAHTSAEAAKGLARLAAQCIDVAYAVAAKGDCSAEHVRILDTYRQRNENLRMNLSLFGKPQGA